MCRLVSVCNEFVLSAGVCVCVRHVCGVTRACVYVCTFMCVW